MRTLDGLTKRACLYVYVPGRKMQVLSTINSPFLNTFAGPTVHPSSDPPITCCGLEFHDHRVSLRCKQGMPYNQSQF